MTRWLLCDYGNVLSLPQPATAVVGLAELAGFEADVFEGRYWADRMAYDRADLDAAGYWARVLGTPVDDDRLGALIALDVAGWTHLNQSTLAATQRAAQRGYRLALLSNAPIEVARAVEQLSPLAPFSPRWFSCDVRITKPEAEIYALVRRGLDGEVTFLDDRPDNVAGAQAAGLHALVFEDPAQIDDL